MKIPYTQCGMIPIPHKEARHPHSGRGCAPQVLYEIDGLVAYCTWKALRKF